MESIQFYKLIKAGRYAGWGLDISSDLYSYRHEEDGEYRTGESHFVRLISPEGYVFLPESSWYRREQAEQSLENLLVRFNRDEIDASSWYPARPVYGSLAYQREGCEEEQLEWERGHE